MAFQKSNKKYPSLDQVNANGILQVEVVNQSTIDYTALLTSIDTKLDELALIKGEVQTANNTLTSINADTTAIKTDTSGILTQVTDANTKLEDIKSKLDTQTTKLEELKTLVTDTNAKLDTSNVLLTDIAASNNAIKTSLQTIETDIASIKTDIAEIKTDIAAIKTDVAAIAQDTAAIKTAVQSIDTKLDTVNTTLESIGTKLDTIHTDLTLLNTTMQAEFDETQAKLEEIKNVLQLTQDTFQIQDCDGNPIGDPQNVQKTVVLNKTVASICNTSDIVEPIVDALQQGSSSKTNDVFSWKAAAGDTLTIPAGSFSTVAFLAASGEFKIENSSNNFASNFTTSSGIVFSFVEISEDGNGTATGSTSVAQGYDTRSNANDLNPANNSWLITCVRNGVLQLDLYI